MNCIGKINKPNNIKIINFINNNKCSLWRKGLYALTALLFEALFFFFIITGVVPGWLPSKNNFPLLREKFLGSSPLCFESSTLFRSPPPSFHPLKDNEGRNTNKRSTWYLRALEEAHPLSYSRYHITFLGGIFVFSAKENGKIKERAVKIKISLCTEVFPAPSPTPP